jgi:ribosome assembly protein YihI (activator of Der GTPase)
MTGILKNGNKKQAKTRPGEDKKTPKTSENQSRKRKKRKKTSGKNPLRSANQFKQSIHPIIQPTFSQ